MEINLKYLFIVEFADGSLFAQNPEDRSTIDPEKRNCYYDVCRMVEEGKVIRRFFLKSTEDKNVVMVDLGTGTFEINGLPVILEGDKLPCLPDKFTLIWYHQVTQNQNVTIDKKTGEVLEKESLPEFREYFIGWQCTINGKNYQQKIAVA